MRYKTRPETKLIVRGIIVDDREDGAQLKHSAAVDEHVRLGRLIAVKPARSRKQSSEKES